MRRRWSRRHTWYSYWCTN